ncbi:MAG: acyl carrier protein [Gemmatimonadaceae bacterium]|mgnify:CR=1 FL=1|nr:acyl carrier protein [Gemmatimonadaceae bacterium]
MQDFKTPLRSFIQDNFLMGATGTTFGDADSFMARRIIDSTGFLELVMFLEETWGVTVQDDEMVPENLDSLDALQGYLARKLA